MDLNLDNYSLIELLNILQVDEQSISINTLQICLYNKIEQLKTIDAKDLPENKEFLIEFYIKSFFKLLKNINNINNINKSQVSNSTILDFEDAYGKTKGNNYNKSYNESAKESLSSKDKLLPPMSNTPAVQENNNFVSKHINHCSLNTFDSHLKYGIINPLTRKAFKKIINLNTKFRNNYTTTSSTNFSIFLPSPIKKVVAMKLVDSQFPNMVYTVSSKLGSNSFIIDNSYIIIPDGSYTSETIEIVINEALVAAGTNITLNYNSNNGLMTFTDNSGNDFSLDFNYNSTQCPQLSSNIYKDQLTLGWLLGFRGNYVSKITSTKASRICLNMIKNQVDISNGYYGSSTYTGESLFDPHGSKYFLIAINDYQNNHNSIFISPFQNQTLADNNIIAKVSTQCCNSCCIEQPQRIYFGPTDIAKLQITIYDEFGRIVDINNADYSLTLELELLYDL